MCLLSRLMETDNFKIKPFVQAYRNQLLTVWERSVLASHDFLDRKDFGEISQLMSGVDFDNFGVYCLMTRSTMAGFIGVDGEKIEMLFIDPTYFGQGYGRKLIDFAISVLEAKHVDVNEQNIAALAFYRNMGFEVFERTEKDELGMNYPLLKMKLVKVR